MPPSGRSDEPERNSTWSMSSPSPSAAIWASAVQAPWPMSAPEVSTSAVPSSRSVARASAWNIGAWKSARAHAPADEMTGCIAHLPRLERTPGPAEPLGALGIALAQRLGREGLARCRVGLGVVAQAKLQRIEPAGQRRLVDRAFEGCRAGGLAGRPHRPGGSGIDPHAAMPRRDRRAGIEIVRSVGRGFDELVEAAGHRDRVMLQRGEPAVGIHSQAQTLLRGAAVADGPEHLVARQHQLDRPPKHARGKNGQDVRAVHDRLRAEAAAEEGAAQKHVLGRNAEKGRKPRLGHRDCLVRRVDGQPVAVPFGDDGMRLHRVVILDRGFVLGVDPLHGGGMTGGEIALLEIGRRAESRPQADRSARRRRIRSARARPHRSGRAGARPRSRPPASRRRRGRWAAWHSARGRSATPRSGSRKGRA